jgi:hypothetical protein
MSSRRCCSAKPGAPQSKANSTTCPWKTFAPNFLPEEPAELELTVVELADGRSVLAVALRPGLVDSIAGQLTEITEERSWRKYRGLPEPA